MKIFAKAFGTIGYLKELKRTKVNEFTLKNSVTIKEIKEKNININEKIISVEKIFLNKDKIDLNDRKKFLFLNGVKLTFEKPDDIYRIYTDNQFLGIGIIKDNLLKRDIIV